RSIHFGFQLAAIEFAHDIGPNRPRRDLGGCGLIALGVRTLVGAAHELAFDEHGSAFLDGCGNSLGELRTEHTDAVPFGFRGPLVLGVLPGALRGDGKNGEFRTVVSRLALLRVRTNKPDESYRVEVRHDLFSPFSDPFSWGTREASCFCLPNE